MRAVPPLAFAAVSLLALTTAAQMAPQPAPLPPPLPASQPVSPYRSPGMRVAGIVLTSIGAAALVAGFGTMLLDLGAKGSIDCSEGCGTLFVGVPLWLTSAVFAGVGIPLWVVGSQPPKPTAAAVPSWLVPTVAAGPRSTSLRWTF